MADGRASVSDDVHSAPFRALDSLYRSHVLVGGAGRLKAEDLLIHYFEKFPVTGISTLVDYISLAQRDTADRVKLPYWFYISGLWKMAQKSAPVGSDRPDVHEAVVSRVYALRALAGFLLFSKAHPNPAAGYPQLLYTGYQNSRRALKSVTAFMNEAEEKLWIDLTFSFYILGILPATELKSVLQEYAGRNLLYEPNLIHLMRFLPGVDLELTDMLRALPQQSQGEGSVGTEEGGVMPRFLARVETSLEGARISLRNLSPFLLLSLSGQASPDHEHAFRFIFGRAMLDVGLEPIMQGISEGEVRTVSRSLPALASAVTDYVAATDAMIAAKVFPEIALNCETQVLATEKRL